ncbi:LOW QUALITY PROTEIN: pyridoxal-dependent decarboxylase [Colletotrichum tofieldiae]|nr:LOW QUALITY PROTEIN: pyridoxal-dependent decarboxylase [Colletotrichum tofieldiae]
MTPPDLHARLRAALSEGDEAPTLPSASALADASASLPRPTGEGYLSALGAEATLAHIIGEVVPGLNGQARSGRYYGFVTGGSLPVAEAADNIVSALDQNVQVHLPSQTVATELESVALRMLADVLGLEGGAGEEEVWKGRTFTTGATASNILGLACGREAVVEKRGGRVGEAGILGGCLAAGVTEIQVLTSMGHSSLSKAASVVGLGRASVKELPASANEPWRLDLGAVERHLNREGVASIIAVSAGEVNTGRFATGGSEEMRRLRGLADKYGAWIHVDGGKFAACDVLSGVMGLLTTFGIFARALEPTPEFERIRDMASGLELADSITVDGHKLLNVPYDCGMFFTRSLPTLALPLLGPFVHPLPLNIGLENSRRFRALPAYAVLRSEGRAGLAAILGRMVLLARRLAQWIRESEAYELLPEGNWDVAETHMVVLFRARDERANEELVGRINATREMYVSGTSWKGRKAVRVAVGSWRVDVDRDFDVVTRVLGVSAQPRSKGPAT